MHLRTLPLGLRGRTCCKPLDSSTCTLNSAVTTGRRAVALSCLTRLEVRDWKPQCPLRAGCPLELYCTAQLFRQEAHQLQPEGVSVAEVHACRQSDAGVADGQNPLPLGSSSQGNSDLSIPVARKGIFQAIREQFIDK